MAKNGPVDVPLMVGKKKIGFTRYDFIFSLYGYFDPPHESADTDAETRQYIEQARIPGQERPQYCRRSQQQHVESDKQIDQSRSYHEYNIPS